MKTQYLTFLKALSDNNNKEWMDANKPWYLEMKKEFLEDAGELLKELTTFEPAMSTMAPKDCVFRQNRDVRFSKDKKPYKNNFAAYFANGGKKSVGPGYYLHLQPGGSFVAGGIWMPPADVLKSVRQEIDYSGDNLLEILNEKQFQAHFGDLEGEKLKTTPKGYDPNHTFINLLRFKSYIVSAPLTDQEINSGIYKSKTIHAFKLMKPFQDYLAKAISFEE